MSKKVILIVLGLFGMILLLNTIGTWPLRKLEVFFPEDEFPKFEKIGPENLQEMLREYRSNTSGEIYDKEFISPDRKLKIKYPSDWIGIDREEILERSIPREEAEKYGLRNLFLAQKFRMEKYAQLRVSEITLDEEETIESLMEEMKESNLQYGWEMEIINSEIKDNEGIFEAKYQKPDRYNVHSKEKIITLKSKEGEKKAYLVVVTTFDKDWESFKKEANFIIDSAQLRQ